jgi:hypothetical protein
MIVMARHRWFIGLLSLCILVAAAVIIYFFSGTTERLAAPLDVHIGNKVPAGGESFSRQVRDEEADVDALPTDLVRIKVIDAEGSPALGAQVRTISNELLLAHARFAGSASHYWLAETEGNARVTDARGWVLMTLEEARDARIVATMGGLSGHILTMIEKPGDYEIMLRQWPSLSVCVTRADGLPGVGVDVEICGESQEYPGPIGQARANERGIAAIPMSPKILERRLPQRNIGAD